MLSKDLSIGPAGSAFRVEWKATQEPQVILARWGLTLPGQHAFWNRYYLSVISLREIDGMPSPIKSKPEYTHEMTVFAVNPELSEAEFIRGTFSILESVNHVVQFTSESDDKAISAARSMVSRLTRGDEFVEPSGISGARERFEESVRYLLEHPEQNQRWISYAFGILPGGDKDLKCELCDERTSTLYVTSEFIDRMAEMITGPDGFTLDVARESGARILCQTHGAELIPEMKSPGQRLFELWDGKKTPPCKLHKPCDHWARLLECTKAMWESIATEFLASRD